MNFYKIRIRAADRLFSKYIKLRDKGLCQYNFKCFKGTSGSDNSHFQKRRKESVRFDPNNCDLSCRQCHFFIENDPIGQRTLEEWKKKQLGETEYKKLILRANQYKRRDDLMDKIYVQALIKDLDENYEKVN